MRPERAVKKYRKIGGERRTAPVNMKIFNVKWTSTSAGPSPYHNERTEVFLAGCRIAEEGHPCKGCFNQELWSSKHFVADETPEAAANKIMRFAPNKYVTFVGGEPLDQLDDLIRTCEILKDNGYHIIVITHYELKERIAHDWFAMDRLVDAIDILIDGAYNEKQRIWDEDKSDDGVHTVIGSGNQIVWDLHDTSPSKSILTGYKAVYLLQLTLTDNNELHCITTDSAKKSLVSAPFACYADFMQPQKEMPVAV